MAFTWGSALRIALLLLLVAAVLTAFFTLPVEKVPSFFIWVSLIYHFEPLNYGCFVILVPFFCFFFFCGMLYVLVMEHYDNFIVKNSIFRRSLVVFPVVLWSFKLSFWSNIFMVLDCSLKNHCMLVWRNVGEPGWNTNYANILCIVEFIPTDFKGLPGMGREGSWSLGPLRAVSII